MNQIDKIYLVLTKSEYRWLKIFLLILLTGFIISTIGIPFLNHDSGFYLKYAWDIHNGFSYYKDLNVAYTPLAMFILSIIFDIYPSISLYFIFLFIVILYFISTLLFYFILCNFKTDKPIAKLISLILLVSLFELDGANIQLEPFVLLFQLTGILLIQKWSVNKNYIWLFLAGLSCFFAFYAKQYGITVAIGMVWYIYSFRNNLKNLVSIVIIFSAGIMFPVLIIILYQIFLQIPLNNILLKLLSINYITGKEIITGIGYDLPHFFKSIYKFIIDLPLVLLLIVFATRKFRPKLNKDLIFVILLISGSCIQLVFAGYRHYYQLIAPYILMLIPLIISNLDSAKQVEFHRYLILLSLIFLITTVPIMTDRFIHRSKRLNHQLTRTEKLTKIIPSGEKVYLQAISPAYYYLCRYKSPDFLKLGYRFPEELSPEYITKSLVQGDYIIVDESYLKFEDFETNYLTLDKFELNDKRTGFILQKK